MTFQQKFLIVVVLSTAAALGLAMRLAFAAHEHGTPRPLPALAVPGALVSIAAALLLVGIVSRTFLRHVIQVAPLVLALGIAVRRPRLAVAAALPLFTFWLFVMAGIWLFLLGIAPVFTGRFSPVEIILTIVIGLASVAGLAAVLRQGIALSLVPRLGTILLFAILQPVAMLLSF